MSTTTYTTDNNFLSVWEDAQYILRTKRNPERLWWRTQTGLHKLHPVVDSIIKQGVRPIDWQQLLLEWPHVSTEDDTALAYTRDERKGEAGVQTRTTVGKYLSRHWPHVPDHVRRDWAGSFTPAVFEIWDTKEMIIAAVELGPQSCMKSSYGTIPFRSDDNHNLISWFRGNKETRVRWDYHPYCVYAPDLGWRMAVRLDKGKPDIVLGRCLLHAEHKLFVRSYKLDEYGGYSHTDEKLEYWLTNTAGYKKGYAWPQGTKFLKVDHPNGGLTAPYLDGEEKHVVEGDEYMIVDSDGAECDNTNGMYDGREKYGDCEDCDDTIYDDDDGRIWVGRNEGRLVCGCCADNYRYVTGADRHGRTVEYYVNDSDAITHVNGDAYDADNLPDEVVVCADGELRDRDDCVEIDDEWYDRDDDDIVECADGEYRLRDDCWESAQGNWYSNDDKQVTVDAGDYHPDELQELIDNA